ncbi:MAG: M50 family metallopeptidase [Gemmatimonadetes bacterium]|nr:M50 family metallopeptidase [Gemmatimonadota bacterium]
MTTKAKNKLTFIAGFSVFFAAIWFLWDTPAIYPLKIFVVMLHEISHGLVAVSTGGSIERIVLDPAQGGACYCPGGNAFLTLSAGYLGSLFWGVALVSAAQSTRVSNRFLVATIGIAVLLLTALYVRNGFGLLFGLGFGATLFAAGRRLGPGANRVLLITLGLTSCLYAILDIKSDILDRPHLESDAAMLGQLTSTPTVLWGVIWTMVALAVVVVAFRKAYQDA